MEKKDTKYTSDVHVLKVQNSDIPYQIFINRKLKNIKISMDLEGIKVFIPYKMETYEIQNILCKKSSWIVKHYEKIKAVQDKTHERKWETGERILYKGQYKNIYVENGQKSGAQVLIDGERLIIQINDRIDPDSRVSIIGEAVRKLYISMARDEINKRLGYFSGIIGVNYNAVRIKEQKTRWGSCSSKGNLNFNWRILLAPPVVMDYVIIHELCHLKHMNHTNQFWSLVEKYMPQYKKVRVWLKENGSSLVF